MSCFISKRSIPQMGSFFDDIFCIKVPKMLLQGGKKKFQAFKEEKMPADPVIVK